MSDDAPTRLLLVDDERESVRSLALIFADYEVLLASDGEEALALAVQAQPDAIILDVMMPGMDGFECCRRLKSDPRTRHIPIVFITGVDREDAETRGLALGAADFVAKPVNPVVLRKRVQIQLDLKRGREQLLRLAATDGLTGLANRRHFDDVLAREYARLARTRAELSLLLVDIDRFKAFNDGYGHVRGDECLRQVAWAISGAMFRPADLVARYGGEEFACILPETGAGGALVTAQRACAAVQSVAIPHPDGISCVVTASVGAATATCVPGGSETELVACADRQLYLAKSAGRNRVCMEPAVG